MPKTPRYDPPTIEQEVPVLQPQPAQPTFSFMELVKKTGTLPKSGRSRTIDPLTLAKQKVIAALDTQEGFVRDLMDNKPLPKASGGEKTVNTWFSKHNDGWWTSIRYGMVSIPLGQKGETDLLIGELKDVLSFYGAVKIAIGKGELDAQIGKLQTARSEKLRGSH